MTEQKKKLLEKVTETQTATKALICTHTRLVEIRGKKLRVYYSRHGDDDRPTIFFFHGLFSRLEHWQKQCVFFHNRLSVVAVDLVGHGESDVVDGIVHYKVWSIVQDLLEVFKRYCHPQKNILVGHSYGTTLIAKMFKCCASLREKTSGVIFCSPTLANSQQSKKLELIGKMPCFVMDVCSFFSTLGGTRSQGVHSRVGRFADDSVRQCQLELVQSASSYVAVSASNGASYATLNDYESVTCHVLLLVGEDDRITPTDDMMEIYKHLETPHGPHIVPHAGHNLIGEAAELVNALINKFAIKKCDMPFLTINESSDSDADQSKPKWALKNHSKWKATPSGSKVIGKEKGVCSGFRACKVLRQDDPDHSPENFNKHFGSVGVIIDISKDIPPYLTTDTRLPHYRKLPTISKLPPSLEYVKEFISVAKECFEQFPNTEVAVHCHYGFNRTGFVICCYLVEECGYSPQQALDEFEMCRPPGIKHQHFKDELLTRYSK
eukprot:m.28042 g.28042  ORF g.28042 m.28042 type:complete len:493 (-) comp9421_c0_seq1:357-1835(-)